MLHIRTILENFNDLLIDRGIIVNYYNELLKLSEVDLQLFLESDVKEDKGDLNSLRTLSDDYPSALTTRVQSRGLEVIIYWSMTTGKTFTVAELNLLSKTLEKTRTSYVFTVCMYDKLPTWNNIHAINANGNKIEVFSYSDFILNYKKSLFTPEKIYVLDYQQFIEENPNMEGYDLPKCHFNDYMARYSGARPGQIIGLEREIFLPLSLMSKDMSFRIVVGTEDGDIDSRTGVYFEDY